MKKTNIKKLLTTAGAIALALVMLLTFGGCAAIRNFIDRIIDGYQPYNIPTVKFSDMEYERPDIDALTADVQKLIEKVKGGTANTSYDDVVQELYNVNLTLANWLSMQSLAFIHYSIDTTDEKWVAETAYFDGASDDYMQTVEALYVACAQSEFKAKLEENFFGSGTLDPYVNGPIITDEVAALLQREAELKSEFAAFDYTKLTFSFEGKEGTIDVHAATVSYDDIDRYNALIDALYEAINEAAAPILIEMVKVRKDIARLSGYNSYAEYAYETALYRDYTPAQAEALADEILKKIGPMYISASNSGLMDVFYSDGSTRMSAGQVLDSLEKFASLLGDEFAEAFDYMEKYELYYFGYGSEQLDNSLTTYIPNYYAPFTLIKGTGTVADLVTFAHEFGHFTDSYINYTSNNDLDLSEIASTSLQYLLMDRAGDLGLSESARQSIVNYQKASTVDIYVTQSLYYLFESQLYELSDSELTVENVNALARSIVKDYGLDETDVGPSLAMIWPSVYHFYEQPFYTISYVNADFASIQIYEKELEKKGSGIELYLKLIVWDRSMSFTENLERVGLDTPFSEGAVDRLADNIRKVLEQ